MMVCRTTKRERKQRRRETEERREKETKKGRKAKRRDRVMKRNRLKFDLGSMILDCVFLELLRVCVVRSLPLNPSALCHHFDSFLTASLLCCWFSRCCLFLIGFKQRSTTVTWSYKHVRRNKKCRLA